jgi:hypothetical protein
MKKIDGSRIAALGILAALLLSALAPAAYASTLTVYLNPNSRVTKLASVSSTDFTLTYPAGSSLSTYLKGYNSTKSLSGNFSTGSDAVTGFEGHFEDDSGDHVSIQNMTVSYTYNAKANATALVIHKETDITAWVNNVFKVSNGTVVADLGWRSFYIRGALDLALGGSTIDVNLAGSSLTEGLTGRTNGLELMTGLFASDQLWSRPTLNFSSLNSPLNTWTKGYNSLTNTTTFTKTVSGQSTLSATYTDNGKTYSLTMKSDPSAMIAVRGYADATANGITFSSVPVYLNPITWVGAGAATAVIAGVVIYLAKRGSLGSWGHKPSTLGAQPSLQ